MFSFLSSRADWPMWRNDYHRSASTPEGLSPELYPQWQVKYSPRVPVWDDPLNQDLMKFDEHFEPVVAGNKIFIGFNDQDKVVALDLHSGEELWQFYADGPVRLPLAVNRDMLYFTGDDGYCYCLDTADGTVVWKRLLAPSDQKLLGNKRMISMWPARGGIVIKDDVVYTAASIFPMMGTYIYALHAGSGEVIWKNEGTGSNYILQPHRSPAFADVAPQGPFTISGDILLVAGGRSVPAAFHLKTGEQLYYHLAASGKTGGAFTCANDKVYFNHHRERETWMYDSKTGERLSNKAGNYPVVDGDTIYFSGERISAAVLDEDKNLQFIWNTNIAATSDMIKAGNFLYAAHDREIKAIRLKPGNEPECAWNYTAPENVTRLLASNGKLIAVTDQGTMIIFGDQPVKQISEWVGDKSSRNWNVGKARKLIRSTESIEGYCLIAGSSDTRLIKGVLSETGLTVVVIEKDKRRIQLLRTYFNQAGIPANRLCFIPFEGDFSKLPKYFSSLTVLADPEYLDFRDQDMMKKLYETTRPYGGKIVIYSKGEKQKQLVRSFRELDLYGADISEGKTFSEITRSGPLPGAAPWTHHNGDIANTVKSEDRLVRAPLGILWFGGNSNLDVLPRHGHGPGEQVIDGRLIIQGVNSISARDVYTGRVLWKRESEQLKEDNWMVFYDETYDEENPLNPKYNQVHLPGANARGTNYVASREFVYLIEGDRCSVIDITSGETVKTFTTGDKNTQKLGYIGVYEDLLILGSNFAEYEGPENDSIRIKNPKFTNYDVTASRELVVLNRFSGERLWSIKANHGFIHNGVIAGDGILFCLDKLPQYLETKLRRRGEVLPEGTRLLYLDAKSGAIVHEEKADIFGTWLGYSTEYKLLLQSTRPSRDMLNGEEGRRMIVYDVNTRSKLWDKEMRYLNPPIIHHDKIYTEGAGYRLLTGERLTEKDPVTGEDMEWGFKREYGCGFVAASEYLLTFRSASAGFVNLDASEGTGSLGGWKPGCSLNLIAADGVLNSPDYTRTCQCPYQNQTSLALINMPWMTYWTNSNYKWNGNPIKQLGLNFNAPGDRSSDEQVLWFEYPSVAGMSPEIQVVMDTMNFNAIRKEPLSVLSEKTPWVSASALEGIRSLEIQLTKDDATPESFYTVNLYFAELTEAKPGERIFDVYVQDELVISDLDIVREAGKTDKEIIKTCYSVQAGETLKIDLVPVQGNTLISGIELVQENLTTYQDIYED